MLLDFKCQVIPVTLEMVEREIARNNAVGTVDPIAELAYLQDIQNNILDKYLDLDMFAELLVLIDAIGVPAMSDTNAGSIVHVIETHYEDLHYQKHIERVLKAKGDGAPGENVISEDITILFDCYRIQVYRVNPNTMERILAGNW